MWQRVLEMSLAASLGVGVAVLWSDFADPSSTPSPDLTVRTARESPFAKVAVTPVPPELAAQMMEWRDEAEALTPAEVVVDERCRERWLLRLDTLRRHLEAPGTDLEVRNDVHAILASLEQVGVLGG